MYWMNLSTYLVNIWCTSHTSSCWTPYSVQNILQHFSLFSELTISEMEATPIYIITWLSYTTVYPSTKHNTRQMELLKLLLHKTFFSYKVFQIACNTSVPFSVQYRNQYYPISAVRLYLLSKLSRLVHRVVELWRVSSVLAPKDLTCREVLQLKNSQLSLLACNWRHL